MMLHRRLLILGRCPTRQICHIPQLSLQRRPQTRRDQNAVHLRSAICRNDVRRPKPTPRKNGCRSAATSTSSSCHHDHRREKEVADLFASPLGVVLKLMGMVCFSVACLNCLSSCCPLGRFASVAAQNSGSGETRSLCVGAIVGGS